jgi:hypothetical protein
MVAGLCFLVGNAAADGVYKCVGNDGNIVYQGQRCADNRKQEVVAIHSPPPYVPPPQYGKVDDDVTAVMKRQQAARDAAAAREDAYYAQTARTAAQQAAHHVYRDEPSFPTLPAAKVPTGAYQCTTQQGAVFYQATPCPSTYVGGSAKDVYVPPDVNVQVLQSVEQKAVTPYEACLAIRKKKIGVDTTSGKDLDC